jgi:hypothetical protein
MIFRKAKWQSDYYRRCWVSEKKALIWLSVFLALLVLALWGASWVL